MARSAHRRRRATRPRTRPRVVCQRPMSGYAAIGLALGRVARAQSCSRTQDQEDDRPTRQSGTTSQDLRGRRFAPPCAASEAARRRHTSPPSEARADAGARFARGGRDRRQAPAPAPSPLANSAKERPTRLPGGRAAWPTRLHAAGSRPACQQDGHRRSRLAGERARRATSGERRAAMAVLLAGGLATRPTGRRVGRSRRASEASPGVSTALKAGMTPWHRFRSGAGRSEATTASYGSSRLARRVGLSSSWSWVRLHSPGSERGAAPTSPVSSWPRACRARIRRWRAAPIDGCERLGRALVHGSWVSAR